MEGSVIGNYRVVRKLTEGGMGTVYEVVHDRLGKRAALKTLHAEFARRPEFVQRLFDEARAVSLVDHPGLVEVFDCGLDENRVAYILMEYLNGETLGRRLKSLPGQGSGRGRLELPVTLRIARQIASALAATHEKGIVHRDLKPDNVMLVADPEAPGGERAKLLDFGIAKLRAELTEGEDTRHVTMTGTLMGTPTFMSPEQCRGAGHVDERTDVYSLGIMLYLMLGGRPPFVADGPGEIMLMHMTQQPGSLAALAPETPLELVTLVHQMLRKERTERPNMAEVHARLSRLAEALDWMGTTGSHPRLTTGGPASGMGAMAGQGRMVPPGSYSGSMPVPAMPQSGMPHVAMPQSGMPHVAMPQSGMPQAAMHASGVWSAPSQVAIAGGSGSHSSSDMSFSHGSMHPMVYGGEAGGSPSRRRWFVGVAIVTGFLVAAPLWWLIDQRERAEDAPAAIEVEPLPPRPLLPAVGSGAAVPTPTSGAGPAAAGSGPGVGPGNPTPTATPIPTRPTAADPAAPTPVAGDDGTAATRSGQARDDHGGGATRGHGAAEGDSEAGGAEATAGKAARSTHRSGGQKAAAKGAAGDDLLDLLDRRSDPRANQRSSSTETRGPAADKTKPRAVSPSRGNAKEKAHVDPSLF